MNTNFAKIIAPTSIGYAPNAVTIEDTTYFSPTAEQYADAGYYPVVDTPQPEGLFWRYEWQMKKEKVTKVWIAVPDERTAAEKRKYAYETEALIDNDGEMITIDAARNICLEYMFDGTERSSEIINNLSNLIAVAKADIRNMYPNEV